ncbi:glutamate synthase-related protein [candidate division KSB1 bacterium]
MAIFECDVCGYVYDEAAEGLPWKDLPGDWVCPVCDADRSFFKSTETAAEPESAVATVEEPCDDLAGYLKDYQRGSDEVEGYFGDIQKISQTGESIIEPMRTKVPVISWKDILIKGGQLAKMPLNKDEEVSTQTIIGPNAKHPLIIETPVYISHMSFGALSKEAKIALATGSASAQTAMCSGEGGILPESINAAYKYIFEYVPNEYSVTDENLKKADAIEIKIGQSAKPGMGGHLPGDKVTKEIAEIRGFPEGKDIISPSRFKDINNKEDLKNKVDWLREKSDGKPIGIKVAAGNIEADLKFALFADPDFITVDGRAGATGAAPKVVKDSTSVPTIFALYRARKYFSENSVAGVSLLITGGFRISSEFAKALAMGADAVAIGTAAMIAIGCQQYRVCNTGKCPVGIATQLPELRERFDIEKSARRMENYLNVCTEELKTFARLTGNNNIQNMSITDLCTVNSEISGHTDIEHV